MNLRFYELSKCFCLIIFLSFFRNTFAVNTNSDSENSLHKFEGFPGAEWQTEDNFYFYMQAVYSETAERALEAFINSHSPLDLAGLAYSETSQQGEAFLNAMQLEPVYPSEFMGAGESRGQFIAELGQSYNCFTLPGDQFNCSLFGIYGRYVEREGVVGQLLLRTYGGDALSLQVRALMAEDIFAAIIGGETLPEELERRQGQEFRTLAGAYWGAHDQASARQAILEKLQQSDIFEDYVRYFIGGQVGQLDEQGAYYNMLTFTRRVGNEPAQGSALAATAAINGLSLRIFQESGMGLLEEVYFYQNPNVNSRVVTLLYNGHNHFDLLAEVSQDVPLSLNEEQIGLYAKKKLSEIGKLHIDLESMKMIALKKLETLEIGMSTEMKRRLFEAQLQRHLSNFERRHILSFEDIQEAFYCILNQQAIAHLKSFKDSLSISISEEKPILIFNSLDLDIKAFCKRWNEEFVEEYKNIGGLHMFRACFPGVGYFRMMQFIIAVSEDRKKKVNEVHSEITALIIAVQGGHLKIVRELIVAEADINYRGLLGHTPLFTAILEGHLEIAQELIAAGADVNCRNKKGFTALCRAAGAGYLEIVQKLIAAGADVNHKDEDGLTALFYATSNLEVVKELITAGADVNHVDEEGFTALFGAAQEGNLEIVKELIVAGADVNHIDREGSTALLGAVQGGHLEIVKELIAAGADINHSNKKELTALYMAANKGYLEIVRELIAKKASVNQRSEDGATALIVAAYKGYLEVARELINAKADVNQGDKDGLTSLFDAVRNGHLGVVRELIAAGADVNECAVLPVAVLKNHLEIVKELTAAGANVNQECGDVATPLLQAVSNRNYEMTKLLLELGADMHAENSKQLSPFKLSFQRGRTKIKNLFLEFQRKLKGKEAAPAQVKYTTTYEKQPRELLEKKEVQREPEDIKYTAEKYIFTEEDEKAAEELGVDLEIEMESIKKGFYTEEWTLDIERSFQERWSSDRGNKKLKQAKLSDSQEQDQALRLPTDKLSGEKLKLRQGLIAILVDQPKNVHKDIIRTVIERLGGKVEEDTRNRHKVYLRGGNQNKNTLKYVGFYEVRHDKDPKNCLTRRYLKRVAIILERAVRLKLIDPRLLAYFPEEWEGSNSLEKRR